MSAAFQYHNDPNSAIDTSEVQRMGDPGIPGSDTITYANFLAVNTGNQPLSDVGVFIPFAWARIGNSDGSLNHYEALTWSNSQMGFIDSNFDNTGESVLLTPTIVTSSGASTSYVAAGSVADKTDTHIFAQNSSSFRAAEFGTQSAFTPPPGMTPNYTPLESVQPGDLLPFADLGSLAVGQQKTFSIEWTAHWSGADLGAVRVGGAALSVVPDQTGATSAYMLSST